MDCAASPCFAGCPIPALCGVYLQRGINRPAVMTDTLPKPECPTDSVLFEVCLCPSGPAWSAHGCCPSSPVSRTKRVPTPVPLSCVVPVLLQVVWAKGYTELLDRLKEHSTRSGDQVLVDVFGTGPDLQVRHGGLGGLYLEWYLLVHRCANACPGWCSRHDRCLCA